MTLYRSPWARWAALGCLLMMITACKPNPQNDIPYFQAFIQENSHRIADDPYISSTVRPGDKMYEILVNIQHGKHLLAEKQLKILLDDNDPDALFWYGKMTFGDSILTAKPAVNMFHRAVDKGNPYAALMLEPSNFGCLFYKQECDDKWLNIAIENFEQLAEQGDLCAQYFLLQQKQWDQSTKTREQYLNEVIRFAKAHYYQPLMDYIDTILTKETPSSQLKSKNKELEDFAIKLLTVAANDNYIPAVTKIIEYKIRSIDKDDILFDRGINLGSHVSITWKMLFFANDRYNNVLTEEEKYYYALLHNMITGNDRYSNILNNKNSGISIKEKNELKLKAIDKYKTITPMVYIDGFTHRMNWVEQP